MCITSQIYKMKCTVYEYFKNCGKKKDTHSKFGF